MSKLIKIQKPKFVDDLYEIEDIYDEFIYEDNNITYHGIIDLMLEYDNNIKIIDYKLKNINDNAYLKQLNGYKNYIENTFNKDTSIYLYSILDNTLEKI